MLFLLRSLVLYYTLHRNVKIDNKLLATMTCNFKDTMLALYQLYNCFVT